MLVREDLSRITPTNAMPRGSGERPALAYLSGAVVELAGAAVAPAFTRANSMEQE
jgi:hypothetical protein